MTTMNVAFVDALVEKFCERNHEDLPQNDDELKKVLERMQWVGILRQSEIKSYLDTIYTP